MLSLPPSWPSDSCPLTVTEIPVHIEQLFPPLQLHFNCLPLTVSALVLPTFISPLPGSKLPHPQGITGALSSAGSPRAFHWPAECTQPTTLQLNAVSSWCTRSSFLLMFSWPCTCSFTALVSICTYILILWLIFSSTGKWAQSCMIRFLMEINIFETNETA